MLIIVLIATVVYILVSTAFLYLLPLSQVTSDEAFVAQAGAVLFGRAGGMIFAAIVVVCVLSSLAAFIMSAPRVYYAMAKDGLFVRAIARTHPRFGTPANAILLQGFIATILVVIGTFQQIIAYFIFVAVGFLALAGAGLLAARTRNQGAEPAFLTPAYPVPAVVFLVLMPALLVLLALHSPREALFGTAVVAAGLPVYTVFQRQAAPADIAPTNF